MINQINHYAGEDAEPRGGANSVEQMISSSQINGAAGDLKMMRVQRVPVPPAPKSMQIADARALEAYVERRRRLAARIRAENPGCSEEEIEARLEQFGA